MIGLVLLTYEGIGEQMIKAASHMLGHTPEYLAALPATFNDTPESIAPRLSEAITRTDAGDGVLVLTDLYGTTHCNVASGFINSGKVEMVSGLNMAILVKAINYRNKPMVELLNKVQAGGHDSISLCKKLDNYSKLIR